MYTSVTTFQELILGLLCSVLFKGDFCLKLIVKRFLSLMIYFKYIYIHINLKIICNKTGV